jgi:hypothetical protein
MKKRAAAKKPAARKSAPKKSTKSAKAAKPAPTQERVATAGKYTPTPIQGIGWAPFRYPA